jgi:hypothetical protein
VRGEYNLATLILGNVGRETWSSRLGVGRKVDYFAFKRIIVAKSKEIELGFNLAACSKEDCGSERAVSSIMII